MFRTALQEHRKPIVELRFKSALRAESAVPHLILSRLRTEALRYNQPLRPRSTLQ